MVRRALVALLELEPDIEVVAQAADGHEAIAMCQKFQPDVAVLDIEMPGPDGIEVASKLREAGLPAKVVIVTTFDRPGYLRAAMTARLYLSRGSVRNHLSPAIQKLGARNRAEAVAVAQRKGWL